MAAAASSITIELRGVARNLLEPVPSPDAVAFTAASSVALTGSILGELRRADMIAK